MINLNNAEYREPINADRLYRTFTDYEIFQFYLDDAPFDTITLSPLRRERNPSFGLFYSKRYDKWMFKDLATGDKGDAIVLIMKMFGLSYYEACNKIFYDMKGNLKVTLPKKKENTVKGREGVDIKIKSRVWLDHDVKYWKSFGIKYPIIEEYNVIPISHFFINGKVIKAEKYAYAYVENKDGITTYKIYQPFSTKLKFLTNADYSVWQGWTQLPDEGELVLITSSLKDVMSIRSTSPYHTVSLQAESNLPKVNVIEELKNRFDYVVVFYDNDFNSEKNWGRALGTKLFEEYSLDGRIEIPGNYQSKDYSDFYKSHQEEASNWLNKTIDAYRDSRAHPFI